MNNIIKQLKLILEILKYFIEIFCFFFKKIRKLKIIKNKIISKKIPDI